MENFENQSVENQIETENETEMTVEADASGPVLASETPAEGKPTKAKEPTTPAWQTFMAAIDQEIKALGLETEVQKNFVQIKHAETAQRIYVAKQTREVTNVPTTLPLGDRPGLSKRFDGENGKIEALVEPTIESVREALRLLASGQLGKVRPSKRQTKAEKAAPAATAAPATEVSDAVPEPVTAG